MKRLSYIEDAGCLLPNVGRVRKNVGESMENVDKN